MSFTYKTLHFTTFFLNCYFINLFSEKIKKTQMKTQMTSVMIIIGSYASFAQSVDPTVTSANGGSAVFSQGSIAWTIGEPISETYTTTSNMATMGFHQPEVIISGLAEETDGNSSILLYPNPVADELNLNFTGLQEGTYQIAIYDALGKLIYTAKKEVSSATSQSEVIKLDEVANGNYIISIVSTKNNYSKSIKFIKSK
jgi:Secretion system C-terminal sorting domain